MQHSDQASNIAKLNDNDADQPDRLHVAISPIVLGRGTRLWDDLAELERDYTVTSEVAESGVIHVTFAR